MRGIFFIFSKLKSIIVTYKTITSFSIRLTGLALFIKLFDYFSQYTISFYILLDSSTILGRGEEFQHGFNSYLYWNVFTCVANLIISLLLILKADWFAQKLVKSDKEFKIELTVLNVMQLIIATIGTVYLAKSIIELPNTFFALKELVRNYEMDTDKTLLNGGRIIAFIIKISIGCLFIFKSGPISRFALRGLKK